MLGESPKASRAKMHLIPLIRRRPSAVLRAAAYLWVGALAVPAEAILYSIDSMSTRGASGLILENHWRTMGALEAADGMLLFGISTAFIFSVMQSYWPILTRRGR
jgi:hypothetical protein